MIDRDTIREHCLLAIFFYKRITGLDDDFPLDPSSYRATVDALASSVLELTEDLIALTRVVIALEGDQRREAQSRWERN